MSKRKTINALGSLLALTIAGSISSQAHSGIEDLNIDSLKRISAKRAGPRVNEYRFAATINNTGAPLRNVIATATSNVGATVIVEAQIEFGDIDSGETLSTDTFTFQQNRRYRFSPDHLTWTFSADPSGENTAPTIVSSPVTSGIAGSVYHYQVTAEDNDPGDKLTYRLGIAPHGMQIDSDSGLISWTPGSATQADVDVQVTDRAGLLDRQIYLISVKADNNDLPPNIHPIANQQLSIGQTLSLTASATDPESQPLRYQLTSAPKGLVINSASGIMRWQPQNTGNYEVRVQVSDIGGQSDSTSFYVNVDAVESNRAPALAVIAPQTVASLSTWWLQLQGTDPDEDDILRYSLSGAPSGLAVNTHSGQLHWTPSLGDEGQYTITATVTDSVGASASRPFTLQVKGPQQAPIATTDHYRVGIRETLNIGAPGVLNNDSDPNGDPISARSITTPTLGTLDAFNTDGSFTYQPPAIPPIQIGLVEQCEGTVIHSAAEQKTAVADVDADGKTEIVTIQNLSGGGFAIRVFDAASCTQEQRIALDKAYGQALGFPVLVNLDSDPELELVFPYFRWSSYITETHTSARLMAFNLDGTPVWQANNGYSERLSGKQNSPLTDPVAVDLDGDGNVELIASFELGTNSRRLVAINGTDGSVRWESTAVPTYGGFYHTGQYGVADLDLDGSMELIFGPSVISHEGETEFLLPVNLGHNNMAELNISAVANFDDDPYPEILVIDLHYHYLFEHTGALKWRREARIISPTEGGSAHNGWLRPKITVAELDGDPWPEYVVPQVFHGSTKAGFSAFNHDGSELWSHRGSPLISSISTQVLRQCAAFDFDRDGIDELVTQYLPANESQYQLLVLKGSDGSVLTQYPLDDSYGYYSHSYQSGPTVADVDNDGEAEIVTTAYNGFTGRLHIFNGLPGQPFPPARAIRNQGMYRPTYVNSDGSIPTHPRPYWLIPGLNKVNAFAVIPGELADQKDSFSYVASDGNLDSDAATVNITLAAANAPKLISIPIAGASPGFTYQYPALATDADFGETFTWELVSAPAGMTINSFGIISWTPATADLGQHSVQLVVTDSRGYSDTQRFDIDVKPPVTVPELIGQPRTMAASALLNAGLISGSVIENFDLHVAKDRVISQSVNAGTQAGAGSAVDYVVSLGPQPIFMPLLAGTEQAAAIAALNALTLTAGNISYANSDTIAKGSVINQSISAGTEVTGNTAVDLLISGGPALRFNLSKNLLGPSDSSQYNAIAFDEQGNSINLPSDFTISIQAGSASSGDTPIISGTTISTASNTRGDWDLHVQSATLGVSFTDTLVVQENFAAGQAQAGYQQLISQLDGLQNTTTAIVDALKNGDIATAAAEAQRLQNQRNDIDTDDLLLTPAVAPDSGFVFANYNGVPNFGDSNYSNRLRDLKNEVRQTLAFIQQLKQSRTRNDDIRMAAVTASLQRVAQRFANTEPGSNSLLISKNELHSLLSIELPELTLALLDTSITALRDDGLIAANGSINNSFAPAPLLEATQDHQTRPVFFTVSSLMSTTTIHINIIKKLYVPIIRKVVANMQNLALAGAIKAVAEPDAIPGIVSGASLSFHGFHLGHSIIEAQTYASDPRSNYVIMLGPTVLVDMATALTKISKASNSLSASKARIKNLMAAGKVVTSSHGLLTGLKDGVASGLPDDMLKGCVFDNSLLCQQMGFSAGFPSVHQNGAFPGPVLFLVYDASSGKTSIANFLFMPRKPPKPKP